MSNILDAIRKAEAERMDDEVPSLETIVQQRRAGGGRKKQRRLGSLIWIALVVVIGSAVYLYKDTLTHHGGILKQRAVNKSQALLAKVGADSLLSGSQPTQAVVPRNAPPKVAMSGVGASASGLSDQQKQLLNTLQFDVVSYSRDSLKRFVMIGSTTYREGNQLEGFTIQQITDEGVLLDVQGELVLVRP